MADHLKLVPEPSLRERFDAATDPAERGALWKQLVESWRSEGLQQAGNESQFGPVYQE